MSTPQRTAALPVALATIAAVLTVVGILLVRAQRPVEGPVPIVWDKEACAHCHMHIGEPAFAAQVQLPDGTVASFDDPGCMIAWLKQHPAPAPRAIYLRHHTQDRWLLRDEVAFVDADPTPMGFGLAAVERATPNALDWTQAESRVLARTAARAGGM